MVEQVPGFKAKDGNVFPTFEEAETHERKCNALAAFSSTKQKINGGVKDVDALINWMLSNRDAVLELVGPSKEEN